MSGHRRTLGGDHQTGNSLEPRQRLSGLGQTEIDITTPAQGPVALGGPDADHTAGVRGEGVDRPDRDSIQCYTGRDPAASNLLQIRAQTHPLCHLTASVLIVRRRDGLDDGPFPICPDSRARYPQTDQLLRHSS
ncbi:unnamed protein product [Boreogadus saida]